MNVQRYFCRVAFRLANVRQMRKRKQSFSEAIRYDAKHDFDGKTSRRIHFICSRRMECAGDKTFEFNFDNISKSSRVCRAKVAGVIVSKSFFVESGFLFFLFLKITKEYFTKLYVEK